MKIRALQGHCVILYLTTDAACETSEYDFRFPDLRFPCTGISNTLQRRRGIPSLKSWKKSSPGAWAERTYFLVHGDGGTEEGEEGGSQKGDAQE